MGQARAARRVPPWWAASGAVGVVLLVLGLVLWRGGAVPRAVARPLSPPPAVPIPDISRLTPQERFDRLYDRIMQALRTGDTATVARIAPMALGAYQMLESPDTATQRRAAVLRLHFGETTVVRAPPLP